MDPSISFGGIPFWAADILVSSGAKPSTAVLFGSPAYNFTTQENTLFVQAGNGLFGFPQMRIVSSQNRPIRWKQNGESQIVLEDRRAKWWETYASYSANRLRSDGGRLNQKTCREVFQELLALVGETNPNLSYVNTNLYPRLHYSESVPVGKMLDDLCKMCKHTIGFMVSGAVGVFANGFGNSQFLPVNGSTLKAFRQGTSDAQLSHTAISAPTIFESEVSMVARAIEDDGELVSLANASYKPSAGWGAEWPGQFFGVADASQHLAMKSVYRAFVAGSITNDQETDDSTLTGIAEFTGGQTSAWDELSTAEIVSKVTGEFWPETHRGDLATQSTEHWHGKVDVEDNVFYFERPVFRVANGVVSPPVLKSYARHLMRKDDGSFVCEKVGTGKEVLAPWVVPMVRHGIGTNVSQVEEELTAFKLICDTEAAVTRRMEVHADIIPIEVNGQVSHARYKIGGDIASSGVADTEVYFGDGWEGVAL